MQTGWLCRELVTVLWLSPCWQQAPRCLVELAGCNLAVRQSLGQGGGMGGAGGPRGRGEGELTTLSDDTCKELSTSPLPLPFSAPPLLFPPLPPYPPLT